MIEQLRSAWHVLAAAHASMFAAVALYLGGALAIGVRLATVACDLPPLRATAIALSSVFASHVTLGAAAG
jgi:hypothetical protein